MFTDIHSNFISEPLEIVLRNGINACSSISGGIETFPMAEYYMQSLFLRMTGAQEQKMKCICWELATNDYSYRYEYMRNKNYGECSSYEEKNKICNDIIRCIRNREPEFSPYRILDDNSVGINKLAEMKWQHEFQNKLNDILSLFEDSYLTMCYPREYRCFKDELIRKFQSKDFCIINKNGISLLGGGMVAFYKDIVYAHRNRCAHNTVSYQRNLPSFMTLSDNEYKYHNYFYRYALLVLIDVVIMKVYDYYMNMLLHV